MKRSFVVAILAMIILSVLSFSQEEATKSQEGGNNYVVPRGTAVIVRLGNTLSSRDTKNGEVVTLVTTQLIALSDRLALPQGLKVMATVEQIKRPGHIRGKALIVVHPTFIQLNENVSLPFDLGEVRPVEKALGDTYYRQLGDRNIVSPQGRIKFVGQSGTAEDKNEMLRNPLSVGTFWLPTLLKRGPELIVDQGFPLIITFGEDLKIPKDQVEVLEIVPMCPCENTPKTKSEKTDPLGVL